MKFGFKVGIKTINQHNTEPHGESKKYIVRESRFYLTCQKRLIPETEMKGIFESIETFRVTLKVPAFGIQRGQFTQELALTFCKCKICTVHSVKQRVKTGTFNR